MIDPRGTATMRVEFGAHAIGIDALGVLEGRGDRVRRFGARGTSKNSVRGSFIVGEGVGSEKIL